MSPATHPLTVVGLMSGTSHDAIDAAAARISLSKGTIHLQPLGMVSAPYEPDLHASITAVLPPAATSMAEVCRLDTLIGQAFADLAARAVAELCGGEADLLVSHGQTMFHWVEAGAVRGTLQLGQPAWIAERTGLPVVSDLRSRDVAAGGQGAPLVSIVDALWLAGRRAAAVNLGGIANVTLVDPVAAPIAFDTGPANALIDAAVVERTGGRERFDADGALAARGRAHAQALAALLDEPYYQAAPPKSTGKELFHPAYVAQRLAAAGLCVEDLSTEDLIATLTALTARSLAAAIPGAQDVVLSGGGTRNPILLAAIGEAMPMTRVRTSDELGMPSEAKEALAFAVLGFLTVNGLAGALPSCTGARHGSVLGSVTPGTKGIDVPMGEPPRMPMRLRIG